MTGRAVWGTRSARATVPGTYYDYDLQVWVVGRHVQPCGHPSRPDGGHCCNGHKYGLLWIEEARRLEGLGTVGLAGEAEDDMERARR